MSLMLAPIHHWLYKKIRLVESREKAILSAFRDKYGEEAEEIARKIGEKYSFPEEERPLEELIGEAPIHGWLQSQIEKAESREAALIGIFLESFGKEAEELVGKAVYKHAFETGERAGKEYKNSIKNAATSYELLQNYLLDGMPCDHVTEVEEATKERVVWKHFACLHRDHWNLAKVSAQFMCNLNRIWIEGFSHGLNWGITYERKRSIAYGNPYCEDVYQLN